MSTTHTEGIARIAEETGPCVVAVGTREVAEFYADGEEQTTEDEANARRMVACWNACQQIPTEQLEQAIASGGQLAFIGEVAAWTYLP